MRLDVGRSYRVCAMLSILQAILDFKYLHKHYISVRNIHIMVCGKQNLFVLLQRYAQKNTNYTYISLSNIPLLAWD